MISIYIEIILALLLILFLYSNKTETDSSFLGIYRLKKGRFYYLKYYVSRIILKLKKLTNPSHIDKIINNSDNENQKIDKFELYAASDNKNVLIIENNDKIYLRIAELNNKILINEKSMSTFNWKYSDIRNEGLIMFNGKMRNSVNELHNVNVKLNLTEILPKFNFYNEISDANFAKTISKEYWSKDYFKNFIIFQNQEIYGKQGELKGYAEIDNKKYDLYLNFSRISFNGDPSFERICHRYILHHIVLENGNRFCVGVGSLTQQFSCIAIGYVMNIDDCKNFGIDYCDLELHKFAENDADPPRNYSFQVKAKNMVFNIIVKTIAALRFETINEYGYKIIDSGCGFNINGLNGWGTTIWYYRNK